jgi:bifunctional enzyme CysN/CysC
VLCLAALVSPYAVDRQAARAAHERRDLAFLEVHVATTLAECEARDPKGLYARARAGELTGLTGVDAPYEAPERPDLRVEPSEALADAVERLLAILPVS